MVFSRLDTGAVARSLAQIADRESDVAEVFFERLEEVEVRDGADDPGCALTAESGFAVRLLRDGLSWIAARDGFEPSQLASALRQVARALPMAPYPEPRLEQEESEEELAASELREFPGALGRQIRAHRAAFPFRLRLRRHRRWIQVVGTRLVAAPESESFYSSVVELPWGRHGEVLAELGDETAKDLADGLVESFRARDAPPPASGRGTVLLGRAAAAVLLHEAVSHALETDTLVVGGRPEAATGLELGSRLLNLLDDPASGPEPVRRGTDDEGMPVVRRWLLNGGVVQQPLADLFAAQSSSGLTPGAARRSSRHFPPVPRSTHLEMVAGESTDADLLERAGEALYFATASRGSLDPLTGEFALELPHGRRVSGGDLGERVGACRLRGRVAELLQSVVGVGAETRTAGAGWCAKGGQRLPVWATTAPILIDGVEIAG